MRRKAVSHSAEFQPRAELVNPALEWLAQMSQEEFRTVFKDSPIKRAKFSGLRRNAAVAMGNSNQRKFIPRLEKMSQDEDANVAEHARWALEQIK